MPVQIERVSERAVVLRVSGTLTHRDLQLARLGVLQSIPPDAKARVLVVVDNFHGWEHTAKWADESYRDYDERIAGIAIVGDPKWHDLVVTFVGPEGRGFPVAYFEPAQSNEAHAWLEQT